MGFLPEAELRRTISDGLQRTNRDHGGRYLTAIARAVGVDRTTVTRWLNETSTASVDNCRSLASNFPTFFDEHRLIELHALSVQAGSENDMPVTVGATFLNSGADVHQRAAAAIRVEPDVPSDRIIKLTALHLDRRGTDIAADDQMDDETASSIEQFRNAMAQRASDGWRIRNVVVTENAERLYGLRMMIQALEGPDVEIRAYAMRVPLVLSPLIVANREVFVSYDHRRFERPDSAILLQSARAVQWTTEYFDNLFLDAPYILKDTQGANDQAFEQMFEEIGRRESATRR